MFLTVEAMRIAALRARNMLASSPSCMKCTRAYSACNSVQNNRGTTFFQESYAMLNRYELLVAKEESERVDTLRYSWQKLQSLAVSTLMTICHIF